MSAQESSGGLSKWQIAALIGVPVASAFALGAFYYWKSSKSSEEEEDAERGTSGQKDITESETSESKEADDENRVCLDEKC